MLLCSYAPILLYSYTPTATRTATPTPATRTATPTPATATATPTPATATATAPDAATATTTTSCIVCIACIAQPLSTLASEKLATECGHDVTWRSGESKGSSVQYSSKYPASNSIFFQTNPNKRPILTKNNAIKYSS